MAVVHQQISPLGSSGLMNIDSSHKFNRSGDTAYGCIEGVNLEQYQVGVIGGRRKQQTSMHTTCESKSTLIVIIITIKMKALDKVIAVTLRLHFAVRVNNIIIITVHTVLKSANCTVLCIGKSVM